MNTHPTPHPIKVVSRRPAVMYKGPFAQAIFAAIVLLLMHAIKWIDLRIVFDHLCKVI